MSPPFTLLAHLYADPVLAELFSEPATVHGWLHVEAELALAQAECGIIPAADGQTIAATAAGFAPDLPALWRDCRLVGYPILPLVRQLAAAVPPPANGRIHYGATTQDIMDSALARQLAAAAARLAALIGGFGDALDQLVAAHAGTVMAARTHAQQAVPTTLGAKLAVYLDELVRHRDRLATAARQARVVSLAGAGGTAAVWGDQAAQLRQLLAGRLGLRASTVPWHVARDRLTAVALAATAAATTAARFGREIIDLSRTELGEVREAAGHHRGASSTMPQKANPVTSEAVIGLAANAQALATAVLRASEAGHERAAGEWQLEWYALPQVIMLAGGALGLAGDLARGLRPDPARMADNLRADGALLLAEAAMFTIAPVLGREAAHDLVYQAASQVRASGQPLPEVLAGRLPPAAARLAPAVRELRAAAHLGDVERICAAARAAWSEAPEEQ